MLFIMNRMSLDSVSHSHITINKNEISNLLCNVPMSLYHILKNERIFSL